MALNNLRPPKGMKHAKKRIGRGQGSGNGKTAGRGPKGAKSRSGFNFRRGLEGGQVPLPRRAPKGARGPAGGRPRYPPPADGRYRLPRFLRRGGGYRDEQRAHDDSESWRPGAPPPHSVSCLIVIGVPPEDGTGSAKVIT